MPKSVRKENSAIDSLELRATKNTDAKENRLQGREDVMALKEGGEGTKSDHREEEKGVRTCTDGKEEIKAERKKRKSRRRYPSAAAHTRRTR